MSRGARAAFASREALSRALFGSRRVLHPYQFEDLCRMHREQRSMVINYEMGLGKTTMGWALVKLAMMQGKPGSATLPALVVAPKSLLHNWYDEACAYAFGRNERRRVHVYQGSDRETPPLDSLAIITTYDVVRSESGGNGGFLPHMAEFGVLIADEAHIVRNVRLVDQERPDPSKAAAALCRLAERCRWRYALTGTPFVNREQDLMALARLLHPPAGAVALARTPRGARDSALQRWIAHNMVVRRKCDLDLRLPPKHTVVSWLKMCTTEKAAYELGVRDMHALLMEHGGDMRQCSGALLAKITRLRQLCLAPLVATSPSRVDAWFDDPATAGDPLVATVRASTKLHCLAQDVYRCLYATDAKQMLVQIGAGRVPHTRASNERAVVASESKVFLKLLAVALADDAVRTELGVQHLAVPRILLLTGELTSPQRAALLRQFCSTDENDQATVLLTTRPCGGVGLNLNRARYMLIADAWWNAAVMEQLVDRVHRLGQERDVYILRYPMIGTIEEFLLTHETRKKFVSTRYVGSGAAHELARMRFEAQQRRGSESMLRDVVGFLHCQLSAPTVHGDTNGTRRVVTSTCE